MSSPRLNRFRDRYGSWALVAGGSDGIGAEFARQLAERGLNLLLVGRREAPLAGAAAELAGAYGIDARWTARDLAERDDVEALIGECSGLDIGLVVCNAAMSHIELFVEQSFENHDRLLELNVRAPLRLAWSFGRRMKEAGHGGIILLSSMAAFQGTAFSVHYAASKAYLRVLAEGMWTELRGSGVDVVAACPGTVNTPTFLRDEPVNRPGASLPVIEPRTVVTQTLRALGRRPVVVPGAVNRIASFFMQRILPRTTLIALTARATRAMYPSVAGRSRMRLDGDRR